MHRSKTRPQNVDNCQWTWTDIHRKRCATTAERHCNSSKSVVVTAQSVPRNDDVKTPRLSNTESTTHTTKSLHSGSTSSNAKHDDNSRTLVSSPAIHTQPSSTFLAIKSSTYGINCRPVQQMLLTLASFTSHLIVIIFYCKLNFT